MANIREYSNPIADLQPNETGARAFAGLASSQASAGNKIGADIAGGLEAVGDVGVKFATYKDTSAIAHRSAELLASKLQEWQEIAKTSDPNDPTVAKKFLDENLTPALDALRDSAYTDGGRGYAGNQADSIFSHITTVTTTDMAAKAGVGAQVAVARTLNALGAVVTADPASIDKAMLDYGTAIDKIVSENPAITPAMAAKIKQDMLQAGREALADAAVSSAIRANPKAGLAAMDAPAIQPYISPEKRKTFTAYSDAQVRAEDADARSARAEKERVAVNTSQDAMGAYQAQMFDENLNVHVPPGLNKTVLNDPRIIPEHKGPFLAMIKRLQDEGGAVKDSDGLVNHLLIQAAAGELEPTDVYKYVGVGNPSGKVLNQSSANFILSAIKNENPEDRRYLAIFVARQNDIAARVNPVDKIGNMLDSPQAIQAATMRADSQLAYFKGLKAGLKPEQLLDPASKDYIFNDKWVATYMKSGTAGGLRLNGVPPPVAVTPTTGEKAGGRVNEALPAPKTLPPPTQPAPKPGEAPAAAPPKRVELNMDFRGYAAWQKAQIAANPAADVTPGAYARATGKPVERPPLGEIFSNTIGK